MQRDEQSYNETTNRGWGVIIVALTGPPVFNNETNSTDYFNVVADARLATDDFFIDGEYEETNTGIGLYWGRFLAAPGDINGDGVPDLISACPRCKNKFVASGNDSQNLLIFFLNATGHAIGQKRLAYIDIDPELYGTAFPNQRFPGAVQNIGDLDGDGIAEIWVSTNNERPLSVQTPAWYILYLNASGDIRRVVRHLYNETVPPEQVMDSDFFGESCAPIGDLNGDGYVELAIGAQRDESPEFNVSSTGLVYIVYTGPNGTIFSNLTRYMNLSQYISLTEGDSFGAVAVPTGDMNGDGIPDFFIGAGRGDANTSIPNTREGRGYLVYLNQDGSEKEVFPIDETTLPLNDNDLMPGEIFTSSIVPAGDLDGNGVADFLFGSSAAEVNGTFRWGMVRVLYMNRTSEGLCLEDGDVLPPDPLSIGVTVGIIVGSVAIVLLIMGLVFGAALHAELAEEQQNKTSRTRQRRQQRQRRLQ
jgi:hypothetical protein